MSDTESPTVRVRSIVAEILAMDPDGIDVTADLFDDYEADSLNLIEIVTRVEKHFQVVLPQSGLPQARTVTDLCDLLAREAV
ncbi:acyl carrier protein [Actinacidiphila bryophytorum]|jgi:acyl carrier protein|uniref:acyl carrier protein n=1 Tax=Actinacidiphila bryophytorum TaxID=1436133 RepID=UPI002176C0AE|nr:acyl carrier protein [Actinacidiphila bryophytorum]UWE11322.1 acyl carrier protein [Actinacidiphila bryophytorum]